MGQELTVGRWEQEEHSGTEGHLGSPHSSRRAQVPWWYFWRWFSRGGLPQGTRWHSPRWPECICGPWRFQERPYHANPLEVHTSDAEWDEWDGCKLPRQGTLTLGSPLAEISFLCHYTWPVEVVPEVTAQGVWVGQVHHHVILGAGYLVGDHRLSSVIQCDRRWGCLWLENRTWAAPGWVFGSRSLLVAPGSSSISGGHPLSVHAQSCPHR